MTQDLAPRDRSEKWIKDYCAEIGCRVDEIMGAAETWIWSKGEDYWVDGGRWVGTWLNKEFWAHYETVTGTVVDAKLRDNFFSCSC